MTPPFLPYGRHSIDESDIAAVSAVLRGDWLTTGPTVEAFEAALAEAVGARFAVVCSSGTAALHLAALALGVGPGDRVIVPTLTFLATANAPHLAGAEIVFADVDPDTALLTSEALEAAFQRAGGPVRAVFPVHMNGQTCGMRALAEIAAKHDAIIVEDASHALASTYKIDGEEYPVGACSHSTMACFSFHPVKTIAMGEGGAVTTNDAELCERLRQLRNHGMNRNRHQFACPDEAFDAHGEAHPWYYELSRPGLNYRASDINCALALSQLQRLHEFAAKRRMLAAAYDARFADFGPNLRPVPRVPHCDPALHLYVLLVEWQRLTNARRGDVMRELTSLGIGTQVHYLPVHRQPYYRDRYGRQELGGADEYYRRALSIPLYPALSEADVERVVASLAEVLDG